MLEFPADACCVEKHRWSSQSLLCLVYKSVAFNRLKVVMGGEQGGVLISCIAVTLASLRCEDGASGVFTDQADIAFAKREAP